MFEDAAALSAWLLAREFRLEALASTEARTVTLSAFQAEAAQRAERILEQYGGVLVADSVGLGKTYIGVALLEAQLRRGARHMLVTTPASLRSQWWPLLRRVARNASASLITARGAAQPARRLVCWLSHTSLSRERWPASLQPDLVLVDEAHAFRHAHTRRYRALAALCSRSRVVLLTATPVNNSLQDLYWQLRLFLGDDALSGAGVSDLGLAFAEAAAAGRLGPPLDSAVAAVTVRRTRRMVEHREPAVAGRFPRRALPAAIPYDMDSLVPGFHQRLGDCVAGLELDAFGLAGTSAAERATPVQLLRLSLLKRLESSVHAFSASASALERYLRSFARATRDGYRLSPADHRALAGPARAQLALFGVALDPLPRRIQGDALADSALADADRLSAARQLVQPLLARDPKLAALRTWLRGTHADRKVLIFTEYRDTALHLWQSLQSSFRVALVHGGGARIGASPVSRQEAVARFSPRSNGRPPPPAAERVDLLVATDVLAEGLNLQDAADVVSYDLPWNPVRLIQRMGRIDRLGSPHECVYCWNFLPGRSLESWLGLMRRLAVKLRAIDSVGGDTRIMAWRRHRTRVNDAARGIAARAGSPADRAMDLDRVALVARKLERGDPGLFAEIEAADDGPFATLERARTLAERLNREARSLESGAHGAAQGPRFAVAPRGRGDGCCIVAVEVAETVPLRWFVMERGRLREDRIAALQRLVEWLECGARSAPPPDGHREVLERAAAAALTAVQPRGDTPLRLRCAMGLVRRHLMRAIAREPAGLARSLSARADRLLERLVASPRAGPELAVLQTVRETQSGARAAGPRAGRTARVDAATLLERLEAACAPVAKTVAGPEGSSRPRVIAVLGFGPEPVASVTGDQPGVAGPALGGGLAPGVGRSV